jgi:hypothetical protein
VEIAIYLRPGHFDGAIAADRSTQGLTGAGFRVNQNRDPID